MIRALIVVLWNNDHKNTVRKNRIESVQKNLSILPKETWLGIA